MLLELTQAQMQSLTAIEAHRFVEQVRTDIVIEFPALALTSGLSDRLWMAYQAARQVGVNDDANVVAFLKFEAISPGFYRQPRILKLLTRPGASADQRFKDFVAVAQWRQHHQDPMQGVIPYVHGISGNTGGGSGFRGFFGQCWNRIIRRCSDGDGGKPAG